MNRNTTMPQAIPTPIAACNAGVVGRKPTKPCRTDKDARTMPYCTVLDLSACLIAIIVRPPRRRCELSVCLFSVRLLAGQRSVEAPACSGQWPGSQGRHVAVTQCSDSASASMDRLDFISLTSEWRAFSFKSITASMLSIDIPY